MPLKVQSRSIQQRGQWTLMGLLVVMAIIVIMSAWLYPKYMTSGGVDGSVQSPEEDAKDVACGTYYSQIGDAIVAYRDDHGHLPRSLRALKSEGVTQDMYDDPFCKFTYDPTTGMLGDRDVALPAASSASNTQSPNTSAGTPGYNGVATSAAPPAPSGPQPGSGPNTDIYSKAAHSGDAAGYGGDSGGGGGGYGGGHHGDGGGGSGGGSDPMSNLINQ